MPLYRFYRESTGKWEDVEPEVWQWVAHYEDGTVLQQFEDRVSYSEDGAGLFHQFREINQDKLHSFAMVHHGSPSLPPLILMWKKGRKLIHFYTNTILDYGEPHERRFRVYCFGYEENNHKVIMMIMPDGGVVITDDHNRVTVT